MRTFWTLERFLAALDTRADVPARTAVSGRSLLLTEVYLIVTTCGSSSGRRFGVARESGTTEVLMQARIGLKRAVISVSFLLLTGLAWDASAAPIELENEVGVSWSDAPCIEKPSLCSNTGGMPVLVFGAPRLVPNASAVGDLLIINVDFSSIALDGTFAGFPVSNRLFLKVGDEALNEVFRPGTDIPLQLSYLFEPNGFDSSGMRIPATDVMLNLESFDGFDLLPQGNLIFTVRFNPVATPIGPRSELPDHAVAITISGPGEEIHSVPEPGASVLLLMGLTSAGLSSWWRRVS